LLLSIAFVVILAIPHYRRFIGQNYLHTFIYRLLPYLIDLSGEGANESYSPWRMGSDDLELRTEPPPFSCGINMDFGYGQDMARFSEFEKSLPESNGAIPASRELVKSDFLRAEKAGYQEGDFDLYDFDAPDNQFGRAALQEKKITPMKKVMQQRKVESSRDTRKPRKGMHNNFILKKTKNGEFPKNFW